MKRALLYVFSIACLVVYSLSLNRQFMEWWVDLRTYSIEAPVTRARYGDLYSNCFLPGYMDTGYIPLKKIPSGNELTDLFIIHDSYLEGKLKRENFSGISRLITTHYNDPGMHVNLAAGKKNILVIECSERSAEWRMTDTATIFDKFRFYAPLPKPASSENPPTADLFFNPLINQNLELSLYDYEYFRPVKEFKAYVNYKLFKRLPKDVTMSSDEKYLFLSETVETKEIASSFRALDYNYEEYVIKRANDITTRFKKIGFDEVYFSIIPNPVSILDQGRMPYNNKIRFLQTHPLAQCRFISIYDIFLQTPVKIYRTDDSHWNGNGIQLWVDEVNKITVP